MAALACAAARQSKRSSLSITSLTTAPQSARRKERPALSGTTGLYPEASQRIDIASCATAAMKLAHSTDPAHTSDVHQWLNRLDQVDAQKVLVGVFGFSVTPTVGVQF